jgi:hypothetical protein
MAWGWDDLKQSLGFGDDKTTTSAAPTRIRDDIEMKPTDAGWKDLLQGVDPSLYDPNISNKQWSDMDYANYVTNDPRSALYTPPAPAVQEESTADKVRHGLTEFRKKYITGGVDKAMNFVQEHPNLTAAGLGGLGGLGGYMAAKGDYQDALNTLKRSADLAGTYEALGPSKVAAIQDNPELKAMQMQALKKTQEEALMGTTAEDEAFRRQQQKLVSQGFKSREAQQQDEQARRGVQAGSGLAMMQGLANNQTALQQSSEAADADMLRKAAARRGAIGNLANQAAGMQNAEFNRDVTRGTAADQFNMTNVANKMSAARAQANQLGSLSNAQTAYGKTKAELGTSLGNIGMQGAVGFDKLKQQPQQQNKPT